MIPKNEKRKYNWLISPNDVVTLFIDVEPPDATSQDETFPMSAAALARAAALHPNKRRNITESKIEGYLGSVVGPP